MTILNEMYIGNRLSHTDMAKALGRSVFKLNESMAKQIRSVALTKGINKTKKGKRLEFYVVTGEEFEKLTNSSSSSLIKLNKDIEWLPLIAVDKEKMSIGIDTVNSKKEYSSRIKPEVYQQYKRDLLDALDGAVVKIQDDSKVELLKSNSNDNPGFKIGDMFQIKRFDFYKDGIDEFVIARVTKINKKSLVYEVLELKEWFVGYDQYEDEEPTTTQYNNIVFEGWNSWDGLTKTTVPFEGNEDQFTVFPNRIKVRLPYRNTKKYLNKLNVDLGYSIRYIPS